MEEEEEEDTSERDSITFQRRLYRNISLLLSLSDDHRILNLTNRHLTITILNRTSITSNLLHVTPLQSPCREDILFRTIPIMLNPPSSCRRCLLFQIDTEHQNNSKIYTPRLTYPLLSITFNLPQSLLSSRRQTHSLTLLSLNLFTAALPSSLPLPTGMPTHGLRYPNIDQRIRRRKASRRFPRLLRIVVLPSLQALQTTLPMLTSTINLLPLLRNDSTKMTHLSQRSITSISQTSQKNQVSQRAYLQTRPFTWILQILRSTKVVASHGLWQVTTLSNTPRSPRSKSVAPQ